MKCPSCSTVNLSLAERQGVEIDYCPECRGVWLDRGELDKIIEKSQAQAPQNVYPEQQSPYGDYRPQQHETRHHDDDDYRKHGYNKKKSWLSEIFD